MDNMEAWKRAQFREKFKELEDFVDDYSQGIIGVDQLILEVDCWVKVQKNVPVPPDPELEKALRAEWVEKGDIDVFRKYSELGMSQRDMGRVCGVSAAAISRWLSGQRTRRFAE